MNQNEIRFFKISGNDQVEKIKKQILRLMITKSDLETTDQVLHSIVNLIDTNTPDISRAIQSMTVHAIISYTRCFNSAYSFPLNHDIYNDTFEQKTPPRVGEQEVSERMFHSLIMNYRNKHIAHSDDFLKSGEVGGAQTEHGFGIAPFIASRVPHEGRDFYCSLGRLTQKASAKIQERLNEAQQKLLTMLQNGTARITDEPANVTPIPLEVNVLNMWGLTES